MLLAGAAALAVPRAGIAAPRALHDIAAERGIAFGTYVYDDLIDKDPQLGRLAAREAALVTASVFHWVKVAPALGRAPISPRWIRSSPGRGRTS